MIHSLGYYEDYKKQKTKLKPSTYLSNKIKTKTATIKSKEFIQDFWLKHDLASAIKTHKQKAQKLGKDEIFLADLLGAEALVNTCLAQSADLWRVIAFTPCWNT